MSVLAHRSPVVPAAGKDADGRADQRPRPSPATALKGAVGFVALIGLYEISRGVDLLPSSSFPASSAIGAAVVDGFADGQLGRGLTNTALAWLMGVGLAAAIGVVLGIAVGLSRWADSALGRVIEFLRPIPVVALVPMAIVLFGIDLSMQVFLIALACVWPVLLGSRGGVRAVDPLQVDTARTFGLGRLAVVSHVVLPASVPGIATSLRVGASLGLIVAVAAEIISGSPGLGRVLIENQRSGNPDTVWAVLIVTGLFGVVINLILGLLERYVAGWQELSTEGRR